MTDQTKNWNWKIIPNSAGKYEITDGEEGKIHARMVGKEKYLKLVPIGSGNNFVVLTVRDVTGGSGRSRGEGVHRIVWETFRKKIPKGCKVVMINGILKDCRLSNLRIKY